MDHLKTSINDVKKLVCKFFLQSTIDSSDVTKIIDSLKTQLNNKILDTLLEGFREVIGEERVHLGNAFFVKDILHIILYSNQFETITMADDDLKLKIANLLTLNAKAFVQLEEEEKRFHNETKRIVSKYRFILDHELDEIKAKLKDLL